MELTKNKMGRKPHKEKSKTYRIDLKPSAVEKAGGWSEIKKIIQKKLSIKQKLN